MKILFLSVFGVLNTQRMFDAAPNDRTLNPEACERLKEIVRATGAQIVLTCGWRRHSKATQALVDAGIMAFAHQHWATKDLPDTWSSNLRHVMTWRGQEISEWLSRHQEVTSYAILDHESCVLPEQMPRLVQTSPLVGLTEAHAGRLTQLLSEPALELAA